MKRTHPFCSGTALIRLRPGISAVVTGALAIVLSSVALPGAAVEGNISPAAIEIDTNANLYPSGAAGLLDWVKDSLTNTDTPALSNSIAIGIMPGLTGVAGGKGHWNGVRIVDAVNANEQDIFLNGGKENDASTWTVGPGSVGSAKYDITQAYLANNQSTLFFGMERGGNNGTTAFDFEFNQAGPNPATPYIPTRTIGDVLFTFEMSGSGSSGSAVPHVFSWNGSTYVERIPVPASLVSSINNADTPAAPWGYVDSKGNWATGNIPRFEFAEASVKISDVFPNFTACSDSVAFVQVRTRSSATDTSDLKDTTKYFQFRFGGPEPIAALNTTCAGQLVFDGSGSKDSGGSTNLSYIWTFTPPAGVSMNGTGITGPDLNGRYHSALMSGVANVSFPTNVGSAQITSTLAVMEGGTCSAGASPQSLTVMRPLAVSIVTKEMSGSTLAVTLTASAPAGVSYQWQRLNAGNWVNISGATASTLSYSSFETDSTPQVLDMTIIGDPYQGRLYQVQIRVHAERTVNGLTCAADSPPVTVKKIIAVDP